MSDLGHISVTVPGEPVPYMRVARWRGRSMVPDKMQDAKRTIGWETKRQNPGIAPTSSRVTVLISFYTNNRRSDLDNLLKLALDALNGIVFLDDRQVTKIEAYLTRGVEEPCTTIQVLPWAS